MRLFIMVLVCIFWSHPTDLAAQNSPEALVTARVTLSDEGARLVLEAACESAREKGVNVSIAVVDANGRLLAFRRIGNAFPATIENAIAKASTAAQLGSPSRVLQDAVDGGQISYLAIEGMTPLQGGMPVFLDGKIIGGVGSSGAAPEIDELIAQSGADITERLN